MRRPRAVWCLLVLLTLSGFGPLRVAGFDRESFNEIKKQAEKGDSEAELQLAMIYDSGQGAPQNYGEALKWYRRAAERGNAIAQNNLGVLYMNGQGGQQNQAEGIRWLRRSAEQGYPKAQMNLGNLYGEGRGVPRNYTDALLWLRKAAEQNDAVAQRNLGAVFVNGDWVRKNYLEAYKWFSLAAAQGDEASATHRDRLASEMTAQQVSESQRLAAAFVPVKTFKQAGVPSATGTGFFVTKNGYFVTAAHVVESAPRVIIKTKNLRLVAAVVKTNLVNDIALLKVLGAIPPGYQASSQKPIPDNTSLVRVSDSFVPVPMIDSGSVRLGDSIATFGFPNTRIQGSEPKFTRGEINSLAGIKDDARHFQISAPVQPGNSGGPLFDSFGNVIGMVVLRLNDLALLLKTGTVPQNVNYALKSSQLLPFVKSVSSLQAQLIGQRNASEEKGTDWVAQAQNSIGLVQVY